MTVITQGVTRSDRTRTLAGVEDRGVFQKRNKVVVSRGPQRWEESAQRRESLCVARVEWEEAEGWEADEVSQKQTTEGPCGRQFHMQNLLYFHLKFSLDTCFSSGIMDSKVRTAGSHKPENFAQFFLLMTMLSLHC